MENKYQIVQRMGIMSLLSLFFIFNLSATVAQDATEQGQKQNGLRTYIVRVKKPEGRITMQSEDLDSWYQSFLSSTGGSSSQQSRMVYSYRNVITGFAARLTADEVKAMEVQDGFISAQPQRILPLHTTHTPKFLGLHTNVGFWKEAKFGKGVIIGLLDTGIFPDHPSFSDERVPPPPVKWKGKCEFNGTVCNNKLIGARAFGNGREIVGAPPVDDEGHGTHTASTAAGNFVKDASVLGNANGTAAGMAPYAHLAMYKVCYAGGCADSDILAGLDTAIEDGVDIISISLGGFSVPFFDDSIAVGAFAAIQRGIFVSCSAGNSGPFLGSLSNEAPWILTVGASTIDRSIRATAVLGNGDEYNGESLFQPHDFSPTLLPLVYAGAKGDESSVYCAPGSLSGVDVKGKVVLCEEGGGVFDIDKGVAVSLAGGVAMILMNDKISGYSTLAEAHVLPATEISYAAGLNILAYINSTSAPMATISFRGTIIGDRSAPAVTFFSSRGPSVASPDILKPDIIGPGVNILAAWPFPLNNDTSEKPTFNIISGTSMSCPHLAGIAALLKSSHPDWSPAAIKSAIMTTADLVNLGGKPILDERLLPADIFAIGAGHVNPSKANDPGFIYDLQPDDYIPYLCGLNYTDKEVGIIVQHPRVNCSELISIPGGQLNYPSISIVMGSTIQSYSRTVTNVGPANSSYSSELVVPPGLQAMSVAPGVIKFTEVNQKVTYTVEFYPDSSRVSQTYSQGYIRWFSDTHSVRTPISVFFE